MRYITFRRALQLACATQEQLNGGLGLRVVVPRPLRREQRPRDDVAEVERDDDARDGLARQIGAQLPSFLEALDGLERVLPQVLLPDAIPFVRRPPVPLSAADLRRNWRRAGRPAAVGGLST